ncbi:hypothetical protein BDF14DRAFT_1959929 [Spinellus fusiger]|nr:hypothetical protein BDF14DRAFT_1959929 [Spinellus fusiger]
MHLLSHLHEDILHFRSPIHYETEREEQYNKFIREHILHTNHQLPSCDVAIFFGKKCISMHIFQGGYWQVSGHGGLFTAGAKVKLFQEFCLLVLSCKLTDNNNSSKSIVVGLAGLFSFSSGASPIFGKIVAIDRKKNMATIVPYNFQLASDQTPSTHLQYLTLAVESPNSHTIFSLGQKDSIGNNVVLPLSTTVEVSYDGVVVVEAVDIQSMNECTVLNNLE